MRIAFVGCGAAGRPLGLAWIRAGHSIGAVVCQASSEEAVGVLGQGTPGGSLDDADVVVFATPDDVIAEAAAAHPLRADQVALHLSGAHPSTVLEPTGARTASLHPLRAFADVEGALAALPETWFFTEGDPLAEQLATDLGGHLARISTGGKLRYHAGAAIASNYLVTLLSTARDLFMDAGVEPDAALAALVALARGAVDNVARVGLPHALTGPAARGDEGLVQAHIDALPDETRDLYLALLAATIPVARAKGSLGGDAERALRAMLRP